VIAARSAFQTRVKAHCSWSQEEVAKKSQVKLSFVALVFFAAMPVFAIAESLNCVSTTFNLVSPNDKVCVTHFEDPNVSGVTCYISPRLEKPDGASRLVSTKIHRFLLFHAGKQVPYLSTSPNWWKKRRCLG
jgi:CreA protein